MFVTNCISTTKIQKISEITNFFRHYFLSRTEVRHWGVMTLKGKVIVDAKYEKVEIRDNGIAVVTGITGKTQTINLLKVKE